MKSLTASTLALGNTDFVRFVRGGRCGRAGNKKPHRAVSGGAIKDWPGLALGYRGYGGQRLRLGHHQVTRG